jgi:hypothetical protein
LRQAKHDGKEVLGYDKLDYEKSNVTIMLFCQKLRKKNITAKPGARQHNIRKTMLESIGVGSSQGGRGLMKIENLKVRVNVTVRL